MSGKDRDRLKIHGSDLPSGNRHGHFVITIKIFLDQYPEIGYRYYFPGPEDPPTYFNQLVGYGYFVCNSRLLMRITSPVGAPSSESHKNVDTVDFLVSVDAVDIPASAATDRKEHQNVARVDDATSVIPDILMEAADFTPDVTISDAA